MASNEMKRTTNVLPMEDDTCCPLDTVPHFKECEVAENQDVPKLIKKFNISIIVSSSCH